MSGDSEHPHDSLRALINCSVCRASVHSARPQSRL
jgi:hypothetical protein